MGTASQTTVRWFAVTIEELKREALRLDPSYRAELARELLVSLDELSADEIEHLWLEEAERRRLEVQSGRAVTVPMDEVFAKARAKRA